MVGKCRVRWHNQLQTLTGNPTKGSILPSSLWLALVKPSHHLSYICTHSSKLQPTLLPPPFPDLQLPASTTKTHTQGNGCKAVQEHECVIGRWPFLAACRTPQLPLLIGRGRSHGQMVEVHTSCFLWESFGTNTNLMLLVDNCFSSIADAEASMNVVDPFHDFMYKPCNTANIFTPSNLSKLTWASQKNAALSL
jgi:hypothetical protein